MRWPLQSVLRSCRELPAPASHVPSHHSSDTAANAATGWRTVRTKARATTLGSPPGSGQEGARSPAGQAGSRNDMTPAPTEPAASVPPVAPATKRGARRSATKASSAVAPGPTDASAPAAAAATTAATLSAKAQPPPPVPPPPGLAAPSQTSAPLAPPAPAPSPPPKTTRTRRTKAKPTSDPADPAANPAPGTAARATLPPPAPPPPSLAARAQPAAGLAPAPAVASERRNGLLLVVDGNYLANRAYYGYRGTTLSTKSGVPTSITYGVIKTLQAALREVQPTALAVVFDPRGPTFRSAASLLDPSGTGPTAAAAAQLVAAGRLDWQDLANRLLSGATIRGDLQAASTAEAAATPASFMHPSGSFLPPQAPAPDAAAPATPPSSTAPNGGSYYVPPASPFSSVVGGGSGHPQPDLQAMQVPSSLLAPSLPPPQPSLSPSSPLPSPPAAAPAAAEEAAFAAAFSPSPPPTWAERKAAAALAALREALGPELAGALGLEPGAEAEAGAGPEAAQLQVPAYKAGRTSHGEDFYADFFNLQRLLGLLGCPPLIRPWLEADDLAGLLVREAVQAGMSVRVLTSDRDLYQLVDDTADVALLCPAATGSKAAPRAPLSRSFPFALLREADVAGALGVAPRQVPDYKALTGDDSDRLPGVGGIGPKTAAQLLAAYGSLAGVHAAAEQLTPKRREALQAAAPASLYTLALARVLGTPGAPAPPPGVLPPGLLQHLALRGFDPAPVEVALGELEMGSLLRDARRGGALWRDFGGGRA